MKSDPLAKSMKRLERVKRSGSEFRSELSNVFQLLRALADFCVGRFVGRFIARASMDEVFVSDSFQNGDAVFWGQRTARIEVTIAQTAPRLRP